MVGAGVAGVSALESLRKRGYDGRLTLLSNELERPYNRPPLSKEFLTGELADDDIRLADDAVLTGLRVDTVYGAAATGMDPDRRVISTSAGDIRYDGLILATGSAPIVPASWTELAGVHPLRSLDDARAVRDAMLRGSPRVVVVGGGFIGCELASAARWHGLDTTIVEADALPLQRVLGPVMAEPLARLHRDQGVRLRCGTRVRVLRGAARVEQVELADGSLVPADLVVIGVGAKPETGWLAGSPLAVHPGGQDGVRTDATLRTILPQVYAAGDIARWPGVEPGSSQRMEHWTNAHDQGALAAANLLSPAEAQPYTAVPYVWSDQHGKRLQVAGTTDRGDVHFEELADDGFLAVLTDADAVRGVVGFNRVREFGRRRRTVGTSPIPSQVAR